MDQKLLTWEDGLLEINIAVLILGFTEIELEIIFIAKYIISESLIPRETKVLKIYLVCLHAQSCECS